MTKSKEQKLEKEEVSDLTTGMIKKRNEMLPAVTALIAEVSPKAEVQVKEDEPPPADHEEYVRGLAALRYLDGLLRRTDKKNYIKNIDYSMPRFVTKDQLVVLQKGGIDNLKEYFEHTIPLVRGMFKKSNGTTMPIVLELLHQKVKPISIPGAGVRQDALSSMAALLSGEEKVSAS